MRVWFKLGELEPSSVELPETSIIDDFKKEIKNECSEMLVGIPAAALEIYNTSSSVFEPQRPGAPVPPNTTDTAPLRVTVSSTVGYLPQAKRLKCGLSLDMLVKPRDVPIPVCEEPVFLSGEEWESVEFEIQHHLLCSDEEEGAKRDAFKRVPPMALVRCSRGGKTRALYEIAKICKEKIKVDSVIYVSFNDSTSLGEWEQQNPLQALCVRIAFAALRQSDPYRTKSEQFGQFLSRDFVVGPQQLLEWLGNSSAVLLVDELNNLRMLTEKQSSEASAFGLFLKHHFLGGKVSVFRLFFAHYRYF